MSRLSDSLDRCTAESNFSGVVRVDRGDEVGLARAYGMAHRALGAVNTVDTRFGIASGTKGLTALTVVSLIEDGHLGLATTAREVLGPDLPLIRDDDVADYVLAVPAHELATTEQYLRVLDGFPHTFDPEARFSYCKTSTRSGRRCSAAGWCPTSGWRSWCDRAARCQLKPRATASGSGWSTRPTG